MLPESSSTRWIEPISPPDFADGTALIWLGLNSETKIAFHSFVFFEHLRVSDEENIDDTLGCMAFLGKIGVCFGVELSLFIAAFLSLGSICFSRFGCFVTFFDLFPNFLSLALFVSVFLEFLPPSFRVGFSLTSF